MKKSKEVKPEEKCNIKTCKKKACVGSKYCYRHRHVEVKVVDNKIVGTVIGLGF
jgi:hypothetical protein